MIPWTTDTLQRTDLNPLMHTAGAAAALGLFLHRDSVGARRHRLPAQRILSHRAAGNLHIDMCTWRERFESATVGLLQLERHYVGSRMADSNATYAVKVEQTAHRHRAMLPYLLWRTDLRMALPLHGDLQRTFRLRGHRFGVDRATESGGVLNMLSHTFCRALAIAFLEFLKNAFDLPKAILHALNRHRTSAANPLHLVSQVHQDIEDKLVTRGFVDRKVKLFVEIDEQLRTPCNNARPKRVEGNLQRIEVLLCDALGGNTRRMHLEHGAKLGNFLDVAIGQRLHESAALWRNRDPALAFQPRKRGANR